MIQLAPSDLPASQHQFLDATKLFVTSKNWCWLAGKSRIPRVMISISLAYAWYGCTKSSTQCPNTPQFRCPLFRFWSTVRGVGTIFELWVHNILQLFNDLFAHQRAPPSHVKQNMHACMFFWSLGLKFYLQIIPSPIPALSRTVRRRTSTLCGPHPFQVKK